VEYFFESDQRAVPKTATREQEAEIAADCITYFYGIRRTGERRNFGLSRSILARLFFGRDQSAIKQLYFVVLLPDETVVGPRAEKQL
jgi:hypothetical protein